MVSVIEQRPEEDLETPRREVEAEEEYSPRKLEFDAPGTL